MLRSILLYGVIAGAIVISSMIIGIVTSDGEGAGASQWFGYLIMLIALSSIFFAIKQHRDKELGGVIKFTTGAMLGLGVSAVAGFIYVIGWETHLSMTDHAFIGQWVENAVAQKQAAGVAGAELDAFIAEMEKMKANYANPIYRMPITFLEIFPVGLLVTLVSAALLRNEKFLPAR